MRLSLPSSAVRVAAGEGGRRDGAYQVSGPADGRVHYPRPMPATNR